MAIEKLDKTFLTRGEEGYEDTTGWSKEFGTELVSTVNELIDNAEEIETSVAEVSETEKTNTDNFNTMFNYAMPINDIAGIPRMEQLRKISFDDLPLYGTGLFIMYNPTDKPVNTIWHFYVLQINFTEGSLNVGTMPTYCVQIATGLETQSSTYYGDVLFMRKCAAGTWKDWISVTLS